MNIKKIKTYFWLDLEILKVYKPTEKHFLSIPKIAVKVILVPILTQYRFQITIIWKFKSVS